MAITSGNIQTDRGDRVVGGRSMIPSGLEVRRLCVGRVPIKRLTAVCSTPIATHQATLTEGASTTICLLGTGLYAVVVRVLKIGLAVCPSLAGAFANRLTPVGTIFLGTEKEPLYSAPRCSGSFFGAGARIDGQENQNQDNGRGCSTRKRYRKPTQRHAVHAHLCKTYA